MNLYIKNKLAHTTAIVLVGLFMVSDLFFVDKKYVSTKDFVSSRQVEVPFQETLADQEIAKDPGIFRVFEVQDLMGARTSYFHKSIGGYSAVRPRRVQQLFDYQLAKNNLEVLNMLNVKYVIQKDKEGKDFPAINPDANGNAWFVRDVKLVNKANDEMRLLEGFDTKHAAIFNINLYGEKFNNARLKRNLDDSGTIALEVYKPNYLKYSSKSKNEGLAVFSEIYYPLGWEATVDGVSAEIKQVNYVLRGLEIPANSQEVVFEFKPAAYFIGNKITAAFSATVLLILGFGLFKTIPKK